MRPGGASARRTRFITTSSTLLVLHCMRSTASVAVHALLGKLCAAASVARRGLGTGVVTVMHLWRLARRHRKALSLSQSGGKAASFSSCFGSSMCTRACYLRAVNSEAAAKAGTGGKAISKRAQAAVMLPHASMLWVINARRAPSVELSQPQCQGLCSMSQGHLCDEVPVAIRGGLQMVAAEPPPKLPKPP